MTALCGGGASQPKPFQAAVLSLAANVISDLLALVDSPWMIPIIIAADFQPLTLLTFCASDPPTPVAFTTAEAQAVLNFNFTDPNFASGLTKFKNTVLYAAWYQFCECSSVPTPPITPAPSPPAGTPTIIVTPGVPCGDGSPNLMSNVQWGNSGSNSTSPACSWTNLSNPTSVFCTLSSQIQSGGGWDVPVTWLWGKPFGGTTPANQTGTLLRSGTLQFSGNPPAGYDRLIPSWTGPGGASAIDLVSSTAKVYCNGDGPPTQGCCPPDPSVTAMLKGIYDLVTIIQRQAVPFSYTLGTAHTGLSGHGSFNVQGLLGMAINITTLPSTYQQRWNLPAEIFNAGFLTFSTPDGYPHSVRLEHASQLWLPPRCSVFTQFEYDLGAGVVITATEVVREA